MRLRSSLVLAMCWFGVWAPAQLCGQFVRTGSIDGQVLDASKAAIPAAKVTATAVATSQTVEVLTDQGGRYIFGYLLPGEYRVEAQKQGFRTGVQTVIVELGRRITANIDLEVGNVQESVIVSSETPVLETTTASLNTLITNDLVRNVPQNGRQSTMLWAHVGGTMQVFRDDARFIAANNYSSRIAASGARITQNFFLMDGVANNQGGQINYIPPVDQVQEMNVVANSFDAEYGNASGAVVNVVSKSGTNDLHGTAYYYVRNDTFNTVSHDRKLAGLGSTPLRWNQFGAAVGGPLIKSKIFWFANYEGLRWPLAHGTNVYDVPTNLERQGDFSKTVDSLGQPFRVYDPFSTRASGAQPGGIERDLFPGGIIPAARINPAAKGILSILPAPNRPGRLVGGKIVENLAEPGSRKLTSDNWGIRIDHYMGMHRLFGRVSRTTSPIDDCQSPMAAFYCDVNVRNQNSAGIGDSFTLGPATVISLNAGFSRWTEFDAQNSSHSPSQAGFQSAFVGLLPNNALLPAIFNSDVLDMGVVEQSGYQTYPTYSYSAAITHVRGKHNVKAGYLGMTNQVNNRNYGWIYGSFNFDRRFTQGPDPNLTGTNIGHGLASYLLGTPASGSLDRPASFATQNRVNGWYLQDDIRVSSRLTLNLGLRYDLATLATERFNRSVTGYDFSTPNPIASQAKANYAKNPIGELPVDQFSVMGGLVFATPSARTRAPADKDDFSPRVGAAYLLNSKTVLRGGYGHFYNYVGAMPISQTGFSSTTSMFTSLDGVTPLDLLDAPFPRGAISPTGAADGLATRLGLSIGAVSRNNSSQYLRRWQFGIQRELPWQIRGEAYYIGSESVNQFVGSAAANFNESRILKFLPAKYLALGSQLSQLVPNPFYGLIPSTSALGASMISKQNLLSTYPQFSSLTLSRDPSGSGRYHSLQATVEKRLSNGLALIGTYTFQRQIDQSQYTDPTDSAPSNVISEIWRRHRITLMGTWDLPIGSKQRYFALGGIAGKLISGWQLAWSYNFQSGAALNLPGGMEATGIDPWLPSSQRTNQRWFNTSAFRVQPAFTVRTLSVRSSHLLDLPFNDLDFSLAKSTPIGERMRFEVRADVFKIANQALYLSPVVNINSPAFGRIPGFYGDRQMQLSARLLF